MKLLKKPLSILLSIIMILSVFTIVPLSASAESGAISNLDELLEAIDNSPSEIKLAGDIATDASIAIAGKELTLDLNGHTLSGSVNKVLNITAGSKVTICDSVGRGKIFLQTAKATNNASAIYVLNSDVTFNDGVTVDVMATQPASGSYNNYALDLYYGANGSHQSVIMINDATFHSTRGNAVRQQGSGTKPGSNLSINGGYFYSETGMGISLSTAAGCSSVINGGKFYSSVGSATPASKVAEGKYLLATGATETGYCVLEVVDNLNDAIAYKELSGGQQYYVADCDATNEILDIMNGSVAKIVFIKDTTWNADKVCGYTAGDINSTTGALSYWTPTYVIKDGATLSGSMTVQQTQITVVEDGGVIDSGFFTPAETFEQVAEETVDATTTKYTYESTDYHIEDQNGNKYVTLKQAFGATYSATGPMTFTLLKDITATENASIKAVNGATLELNGHDIDFALSASNSAYGISFAGGTSAKHNRLTVTGEGSINASGNGRAFGLSTAYSDLVIDGENDKLIIKCGAQGIYPSAKNTTVTINGGTISSSDDTYHNDLINAIDSNFTSGSTKLIVNGGKFFGYDPQRCPSEPQVNGKPANLLAEGLAAAWEGNYSTNGYFTVADAVAVADGDNYASIGNAVNKAPGKTITLLKDIDEAYTLAADETLVLDKDGHSITVNAPEGCALIQSEDAGIATYSIHAHDWDTDHIDWQWQGVASAVAVIGCKDDDATQSLDATITSEVTTQPSCTTTGIEKYTATVTINGTEYSDTKEQTLPTVEHSYGAPAWTWDLEAEPVTASATFTCSVCGDTQTVNADITASAVDATLTENGSLEYTASVTFKGAAYNDSRTVILPATGVARIGETYYASVQEAVDAAKLGDTVVIVADHTFPASAKTNKSMTIDLHGKVVEYSTGNNNAAFDAESGTLKIKDTSDSKTGTIKVTKPLSNLMAPPRGAWANTGATVRFESGNIVAPVGIYASAKSTVIVTGGNITAERAAVVASGSKDETAAKAYISGGTLAGVEYGVQADGYSLVNISGGDISGNIGVGVTSGGSTLDIKGGNIAGVENGVKLDGKGITKDATISGGTITAADGNDALNSYLDTFTLTVSGGEFSTVVPAEYCADGFEPVTTPNANGLYEVTREMVAEVNGVQYTSVQEAVDAANAGDTVTLIGDEALQASVKIEKNLTIDLNGHTITYKTVNNNAALYADGITLTVKDSSDPSTGLIKTVKEGDALMTPSGIWANNGATVNFESGNIEAPNGIHVGHSDSVANVSGGTLNATKSALYVSGWNSKGNAHATVTGGTLNGGEYGVNVNGYCDVTIEGGDISGNIGVGVTSGASTLDIKGGNITGTEYGVYLNNTGALVPGTKNVTISDGIITATDGDAIYSPTENFIVAVSGGMFSNSVPENCCAEGYIPSETVASGKYTVVDYSGIAYKANLSLADNIIVNFYVRNLPTNTDLTRYHVEYTFQGETTEASLTDFTDNAFVVAVCAAKEMTDDVSFKVYYGDTLLKEVENYSVQTYCENKIKAADSTQELKDVCYAVLSYGSSSQEFFAYNTDDLADANYQQGEYSGEVPEQYKAVSTGTLDATVRANLTLETETVLHFYFKPKGDAALTYTFKDDSGNDMLGNEDVTVEQLDNGYTSITVSHIAAKELNQAYTLELTDGTNTKTVTYSPLSYAYSKQSIPETQRVAGQLYHYWETAKAYFDSEMV